MRKPDYPSFDDACERFEAFAAGQGWPMPVHWIERGNTLRRNQQVFVKVRNEGNATRREYETAVQARLGVVMEALGVDRQGTYATVWSPRDEANAMRCLVPDGLKLSLPDPRRPVKTVRSDIYWTLARMRAMELDPEA